MFDRAGREVAINISAQAHLAHRFYGALGFEYYGAPYDEDGIQHIAMRLNPRLRQRQWPVIERPQGHFPDGFHPMDLKVG